MKKIYLLLLMLNVILLGCSTTSEVGDNTDDERRTNKREHSITERKNSEEETNLTQSNSEITDTILYENTEYGFDFTLPKSWEGYDIIKNSWEGSAFETNTNVESGPIISIRHPKWTEKNPRQDIPIMIFTISQWNALQYDEFTISAAGVPPTKLGQNNKYVFLLPARYNYAYREGFKEVADILKHDPIQTKNVYD